MQLSVSDPDFADRLATFLTSLGQTATVDAPGRVTLTGDVDEAELAIYLRVWDVLHPQARVNPWFPREPPPSAQSSF